MFSTEKFCFQQPLLQSETLSRQSVKQHRFTKYENAKRINFQSVVDVPWI